MHLVITVSYSETVLRRWSRCRRVISYKIFYRRTQTELHRPNKLYSYAISMLGLPYTILKYISNTRKRNDTAY